MTPIKTFSSKATPSDIFIDKHLSSTGFFVLNILIPFSRQCGNIFTSEGFIASKTHSPEKTPSL